MRRHRKHRKGKPKEHSEAHEKEEGIRLKGTVVENLPNAQFRVKLEEMDTEILAYVSGKMRRHWIRILTGDKVTVEMSPYDTTRARIVYRENR